MDHQCIPQQAFTEVLGATESQVNRERTEVAQPIKTCKDDSSVKKLQLWIDKNGVGEWSESPDVSA